MRDLTKLGFADDLALVAGLEEVGRTCCPQLISLGASADHWTWGH